MDEREARRFNQALQADFAKRDKAILELHQAVQRLQRSHSLTSNRTDGAKGWMDAFESAKSYATVVMTVGYAGLFALWTVGTKEYPLLHAIAGLALFFSIAVYVLWEVWQMAAQAGVLQKAALGDRESEARLNSGRMPGVKAWRWFFGVTVVSALLSGGCIAAALIGGVLKALP